MGCNVLWGPRPAAWDQETTYTEEGLPDADWSTKLHIHVMHFPFIDRAHPTSTVRSSKRTPYIHCPCTPYIHCPIKQMHTLHPLSDQANTHPIHPLSDQANAHPIHPLSDQANAHPTSTVQSSKCTPYIHCPIKQIHTLYIHCPIKQTPDMYI